ncbi:hypothetical protein QCA50_004104 [Cerrena zonata]|uniref:HlyIII-domain-containing protein n=1 Tax=Cerrena zonata TaxID=2478898 RepID=A0AAW0GMZ8_9APHY
MPNTSVATGATVSSTAESLTSRHTVKQDGSDHKSSPSSSCQPLPGSMSNLDFKYASPALIFASFRFQVLSYLADLETRLAMLESPITAESMMAKGETTVEEARLCVKNASELLQRIREDVRSHFPDVHLDLDSVPQFVKSHIPDKHTLDEMRAHALKDHDFSMPTMPAAMRSRLDDVRSRISDIDFHRPLEYIPTLYEHLHTLQLHLSSVELPHSFSDSVGKLKLTPVYDLIDKVLSADFTGEINAESLEGEVEIEHANLQIARAAKASGNGSRLITYPELPDKWKNNPFVTKGYRFIPLEQWPRLIGSVFTWHNETANIHTHFVPFLWWFFSIVPVIPSIAPAISVETDLATVCYMAFALLTLFASSVWHTMSGCAHLKGMQLCARADYISIGWLISASTGSVVYYGFDCYPPQRQLYLSLCAMFCVSATVMPFTSWFEKREYRPYRHAFFIALFLFSWVPLAHISYLYSLREMFTFLRPITYSLYWFFAGFFVYASHFPECVFVTEGKPHWLDWLGGGSHALWHICVVLGVAFHKAALQELKKGFIPGSVCAH